MHAVSHPTWDEGMNTYFSARKAANAESYRTEPTCSQHRDLECVQTSTATGVHARAVVALTLALIHQESATPSLPKR